MDVQQHLVEDRVEHRDAAPVKGVGHAARHVVQQQAEHAATAAECHGKSGAARQRLQRCDSTAVRVGWHVAEEHRAPVLGALVCGYCPSAVVSARASRKEWRRWWEHVTSFALLFASAEVGFVGSSRLAEFPMGVEERPFSAQR